MTSPYLYIPLVSNIYRFVRRKLRLISYSGQAVFCNVCSKSFSQFIGNENGTCPYCGSQTRQRFLVSVLSRNLVERNYRFRTLFFAPDWGVERWLAKKPHQYSVVTADLSAPNVDMRLDITDTKLDDGSFDLVLCSHVLEHVSDDSRAMREIRRLLTPNGLLLLQVPIKLESATTDEDPTVVEPSERQVRFGQFDHVRLYGRDLPGRLEAAGFSVTPVFCKELFDDSQMREFGLWNDVLFICKPL